MSHKKTILTLILIYILALGLRIWFIKDGTFAFGFDQARDAVYAREILSGNFKIFGPTASGTGDTIFHGVAYYYILAGLHFFGEDPIQVVGLIAAISSLSIVPTYLLTKYFTKNNSLGLIAALLAALSYEQITAGTWLSNPAIVIFTLPAFMYFWLKLTKEFTYKNMFWTMIFLGLSVQLLFFKLYWLITPLALFIHQLASNRWKLNKKQISIWIWGAITFVLMISSMILVQFLMIKRGILNLEALSNFNMGTLQTPFDQLLAIAQLWINKVSYSLSPRIGLLAFIFIFAYGLTQENLSKLKYLFWLMFTPIIFLLIYFRANFHLLIGYEVLVYALSIILIFKFLQKISNQLIKNILVISLLTLFITFNISGLTKIKTTHDHPNAIQKGFLYKDQVRLIETTYEHAAGRPFSISTFTNPYNINVTWGYLYDYFGRTQFGYKPSFYGADQTGWVGSDLLEIADIPAEIHFSIIEPDTGVVDFHLKEFLNEQRLNAGTPSASLKFSELELLVF